MLPAASVSSLQRCHAVMGWRNLRWPQVGEFDRPTGVATNQGIRGFWKRIRDDYQTRQVIFEVKNFEEIGVEEYRQMNGYLNREYGSLGFIICRDKQPGLVKGRELEAFREFYTHQKLIVKVTASTLTGILSKLRSPAKIDAGDIALDNQLDTHIRLYSTGQTDQLAPRSKKRKK